MCGATYSMQLLAERDLRSNWATARHIVEAACRRATNLSEAPENLLVVFRENWEAHQYTPLRIARLAERKCTKTATALQYLYVDDLDHFARHVRLHRERVRHIKIRTLCG